MVRILSNGEIVPDDDPRAQSSSRNPSQQQNSAQSGQNRTPRFQNVQAGPTGYNENAQGQPGGQQVSLFQVLNQRLISMGFPRFTLSGITVEPIISVALLLSLLLFGLPGLLLVGVLFAVMQLSQHGSLQAVWQNFTGGGAGNNTNAPPSGQPRGPPRNQPPGNSGRFGGAGHRLGSN